MSRTLPLSAVFDCTFFVQALVNPRGPAGACLTVAQLKEDNLPGRQLRTNHPSFEVVDPLAFLGILKTLRVD